MSTKFGVYKFNKDVQLEDDCLPDTYDKDDFVQVARRCNGMYWSNDLATHLPDDVKVYPLDNTAQGVYTIGDIRREIDGYLD